MIHLSSPRLRKHSARHGGVRRVGFPRQHVALRLVDHLRVRFDRRKLPNSPRLSTTATPTKLAKVRREPSFLDGREVGFPRQHVALRLVDHLRVRFDCERRIDAGVGAFRSRRIRHA
jgi:hypothetical protein